MITLFSPAKINLFLRVLRRRPDGYHDLASLFQAIDLGDLLTFSLAESDSLTVSDPLLPVDDSNLVSKAVALFRRKTGISSCFQIHLEKRIPLQAGLGGGSSNAATTLYALNELCGSPASLQNLIDWSAELGSDITFFFASGTAFCCGRGEIVEPQPQPVQEEITLVKPPQGTSTPEVYSKVDVAALPKRDPKAALHAFYGVAREYFNDLEPAAFTVDPSLADLKQTLLRSGFKSVVLTGSGSSFLCVGQGKAPANCYQIPVQFLQRPPQEWYPAKRVTCEGRHG